MRALCCSLARPHSVVIRVGKTDDRPTRRAMPPATDDAFLAGLFAGIDSQAFEAPPSSSQLVTSVKPTPLPSSSRRKRLALTPIDANTRLSTPRASQKSQPVSSPVSERQGALDALLAGLSESDFACPSSPIPSLEALPTRLAWKGRDERPPGHVCPAPAFGTRCTR